MDKKTMLAALALGAFAMAGCAQNSSTIKTDAVKGDCWGVNACKGQGECGGVQHACAGKNSCKAQGRMFITKEECEKQGGRFEN